MKYLISKYGPSLLIILFSGCIEPFTPEIDSYEDLLVVEALITDEPSSHVIRITRSHPLDTSAVVPESNASVSIIDSDGNQTQFFDGGLGSYLPSSGFNPIPGETYVLSIVRRTGEEYRSNPVIMKATPPIDQTYFQREQIASDELGDLDDGFQVYIDTGSGSEDESYFKFEWEESWEMITPYQSFLDFQNNELIVREDNISNCWSYNESTNLNVASTENFSTKEIQKHPVRFISFREPLLNVRYSILIKQYALSEESYYFWQNLKESNESTGSLYDKQPFQVVGNIQRVDDPLEPVLGYFDMSTVSSSRLFISNLEDVPKEVTVSSIFNDCRVGADSIVSYQDIPRMISTGYLISYYEFMVGYVMAKQSCIDCRSKGTNIKPEFWDE